MHPPTQLQLHRRRLARTQPGKQFAHVLYRVIVDRDDRIALL
jgi:hypothetical protein